MTEPAFLMSSFSRLEYPTLIPVPQHRSRHCQQQTERTHDASCNLQQRIWAFTRNKVLFLPFCRFVYYVISWVAHTGLWIFFSKCKHGHCFAGYLVTVVEPFGLFWGLILHIDHTLNLSGFHHRTLRQIPVPIKSLKGLLYFFKASDFRVHACFQAQGEVWDEVLGSRRLEDLLLCVLSLFRYLRFYCVL